MEGVFLVENQYSSQCGPVSSLDTTDRKQEYVYVLMYLRTNTRIGENYIVRLFYQVQETVTRKKESKNSDSVRPTKDFRNFSPLFSWTVGHASNYPFEVRV